MPHKLVILTIFNPTAITTCLVPEFSEEWILFGFQTYTARPLSLMKHH